MKQSMYAYGYTNQNSKILFEKLLEELHKCCNFAAARGFLVKNCYCDCTPSRPELHRMLQDAQREHIDAVIIAKNGSLAADLKEAVSYLEAFQKLGIRILTLSWDGEDLLGVDNAGNIAALKACAAHSEKD